MITFGDARSEAGKCATHVVVDTKDAYTFWAGASGVPFDYEGAREFAEHRNAEMKPEHRSYRVFRLVEVPEADTADRCEECGAAIPGELISAAHDESCSGHPANVG